MNCEDLGKEFWLMTDARKRATYVAPYVISSAQRLSAPQCGFARRGDERAGRSFHIGLSYRRPNNRVLLRLMPSPLAERQRCAYGVRQSPARLRG